MMIYYETELYHHGVKGMKWGVRRYQNKDGSLTKKGKKRYSESVVLDNGLSLLKRKKRGLASILSKNDNIKKEQARTRDYDIYSKDGKKIGNVELYLENKMSTNIVWLGINEKERGKKYAQSVMDWIIKNESKEGRKQITLEVPGTSPDARHIYEKKGFKAGKRISNDDVWGGLTKMKKQL